MLLVVVSVAVAVIGLLVHVQLTRECPVRIS